MNSKQTTLIYNLTYLKQQHYSYEEFRGNRELSNQVLSALYPQIQRHIACCGSLLQEIGMEAPDAAQEVLLKFFSSEALYNNLLSTDYPLAYLQRSAKNLLLDMRKKQHLAFCPLEDEEGHINIAGSCNTEQQFLHKEDAAAALQTLSNYEEFDVICFLACRYFGIKPRHLAELLQSHGWAVLAKATVKSAGNSFDKANHPLLAQLLQRWFLSC